MLRKSALVPRRRFLVYCPKCKKHFATSRSTVQYYKLPDKGNTPYSKELCTVCGYQFYSAALDARTVVAKLRELSTQDAVSEMLHMISCYRDVTEADKKIATQLVTDVYSFPDEDLYIDITAVDKQCVEPAGCVWY